MPVTRSEVAFFTAGVVVGAVGHAAYPKLKEKLTTLVEGALAGAGDGLGQGYAEIARTLAERFASPKGSTATAAPGTNGAHATNPCAS
jgi:hypothetical protein